MRAIRAMRGVLVFLCSIEHRACALNSFSTFRWAKRQRAQRHRERQRSLPGAGRHSSARREQPHAGVVRLHRSAAASWRGHTCAMGTQFLEWNPETMDPWMPGSNGSNYEYTSRCECMVMRNC